MTLAQAPRWQGVAKAGVAFGLGLFSICAQALLFREYVWHLEGHDLAVGLFLACWLVWVAIGAILSRWLVRPACPLGSGPWTGLLVLAYIPAFILELLLISSIRYLMGTPTYALLPFGRLVVWSFFVCGPVSLATGLLFPLVCRWLVGSWRWPITVVYALESLGSLVGGAGTTLLLAMGWAPAGVWLAASGTLAGLCAWALLAFRPRWAAAVALSVAGACVLALAAGAGGALDSAVVSAKWSKILSTGQLEGAICTAQGQYIYGRFQGQLMTVRDGAVVDVLPEPEGVKRLAGLVLIQRPQCRRVLVAGHGMGLCRAILRIGSITQVDLACPDPQYPVRLGEALPKEFGLDDPRFSLIRQDVRAHLAGTSAPYDLIVIAPSGLPNSSTNRLFTAEFFQIAKGGLAPDGVVAAVIPGGENVIGPELAYLGGSVMGALRAAFANTTLIAGEQTILLAGEGALVDTPEAILRVSGRLEGIDRLYPVDALAASVQPDRIRYTLQQYEQVRTYTGGLVNRDPRPVTQLYGMLLAARQSGLSIMGPAQRVGHLGVLVLVVPAAVIAVLRWGYLLRHRQARGDWPVGFSAAMAVVTSGAAGIGTMLVLLSIQQGLFGDLQTRMGLVSGLFMAGLCVGALAMQALLARLPARGALVALVAVHVGLLVWVSDQLTGPGVGQLELATAFLLAGVFGGAYMPWAALMLGRGGTEVGLAAGQLQWMDHIAAAAGGLVVGLILVPALGTAQTLAGLAAVMAVNIPVEFGRSVSIRRPREGMVDMQLRRVGYLLFGLAACCYIWSVYLWRPVRLADDQAGDLAAIAAQWTAGMDVRPEAVVSRDGRRIKYLRVLSTGALKGYVFSTDQFLHVRGYGGPLSMVVFVDPNGGLIDHRFTECSETPRYLRRVVSWLSQVKGARIWGDAPLEGVDAVTGATITSNAVLQLLGGSGRGFAEQVLRLATAPGEVSVSRWDAQGLFLVLAGMGSVAASWLAGRRLRVLFLVTVCLVGGVWLNAQYSTEHVIGLLWAKLPGLGLNGALLLVLMPLVVGLLGNVYCGYVCPFGGFQEIASMILPKGLRPSVARTAMQKARFVKYLTLFVFVTAFCLTADKSVYSRDLLLRFFDLDSWAEGLGRGRVLIPVFVVLGAGVLLFRRFWCRYICPAGAFLSLCNHLALLGRFVLPRKRFGCCEFGLTGWDELDCIWCDRCRYEDASPGPRGHGRAAWSWVMLAMVAVVAVWLVGGAFSRPVPVTPDAGMREGPTAVQPASPPQGRQVDVDRIRALIDGGRLSDKEAMYYRPVESQE